MRRALTLLILAAVVATCGQHEKQKPTTPAAGVAQLRTARDAAAIAPLVPTDATFLVRIASVDELNDIIGRVRAELPMPLPPDVLPMMTASVGLDPAAVERDQPAFLCANLAAGDAPPKVTLIMPVKDPAAAAAAYKAGGSAVAGGYVALSQLDKGYKAGGSTLPAGILDGDLSVRCDLARLVSTYRADIDKGLRGMEEGLATGARQGLPGFDIGDLTARITEWVRMLVDSAETLDAVVDHDEGRFDIQFALTAAEASPLAQAAAQTKTDLAAVGRRLPDLPITMLYHFDIAGMSDLFLPMLTALMEKRPAEERQAMEEQVRRSAEAAELLTDDWAMALDFGKRGMRIAMVGGASDAQGYLDRYCELLQTPALANMGMAFKNEGSRKVGDTTVERMRMIFDMQKYLSFFGMKDLGPEALGPANAALAVMFGEDGLVFELAAQENRFLVSAGGSDLMDHMLEADEPPAWFEGTTASISGELGFLVRLEMRGCARGFTEMMAKFMPGAPIPTYPEGKDLPVVLYGSVDGRVYRGGLTANLTELASFFGGKDAKEPPK